MTEKIKTHPDDDIPDWLMEIVLGMAESRTVEKLVLTEEIIEATSLDADTAFEKANATIASDKTSQEDDRGSIRKRH